MTAITPFDLYQKLKKPRYSDTDKKLWEFYEDSYFGGQDYKEGKYLYEYENESPDRYKYRLLVTPYTNQCAPIIDLYTSYLFKKPIKRVWGSLDKDELFQMFLDNADNQGNSYEQVMKRSATLSGIYGIIFAFLDMPNFDTNYVTSFDIQLKNKIYPYMTLMEPEDVLSWGMARDTVTGKMGLSWVKIEQEGEEAKDWQSDNSEQCYVVIWTKDTWEKYLLNKKDSSAVLDKEGTNPAKTIPIVPIYNLRGEELMKGLSDIRDIANLNRLHYCHGSSAIQVIDNSAFAMIVIPAEIGADGKEVKTVTVGPGYSVTETPETKNITRYVEPLLNTVGIVREERKELEKQITTLAQMGGVAAIEGMRNFPSGEALKISNQPLNALLTNKAQNIEDAEYNIIRNWLMWRYSGDVAKVDSIMAEVEIEYPDEFDIDSLSSELDILTKMIAAKYPEETLKEKQKELLPMIFPNMESEEQAIQEDAIDANTINAMAALAKAIPQPPQMTPPAKMPPDNMGNMPPQGDM